MANFSIVDVKNQNPMAMKCAKIVLLVQLLPFFLWSQTGADCANAIPLTLDGVCRTYATSSSTGPSVICTSYTGTSPITYFTFTTNNTPDKVLINITAPTAEPCEVALYSSGCGFLYSSNGMCFDDGQGLWSFASNFTIQPNTTYKLRIKTTTSGNIILCAKNYTPTNNTCAGATSIGATPLSDNNACNIGASEISSMALSCGFTLENTAFYKFYVASDGVCVINVNNINCDNGNANNSNGFQAMFFTGECGTLSSLGCQSNSNSTSSSFLQFTTPSLTAGTKVTVALDGLQGSNCAYDISGINIVGVLSADLESFNGWEYGNTNLLKWTILHETENSSYQIERSQNGKDFYSIGKIKSQLNNTKSIYTFEDREPFKTSYYRIRQQLVEGNIALSPVLVLKRKDISGLELNLVNPVANNNLDMTISSKQKGQYVYAIYSLSGQLLYTGYTNCVNGTVRIRKDISQLTMGKYLVTITNNGEKISRSFFKIN